MSITKSQWSTTPLHYHYLIIGPMLAPDGSNLGGATVSLNYLVEYLQKNDYSHQLLDTQYFKNPLKGLLNPIRVVFLFLLRIWKTDVVFVNVSQFGAKTIAPLLYILTRLFGKKFVFRPFGGAMKDHFEKYASWQKWLFKKTLLQSDIFFLQTNQLVNFFNPLGRNVLKLPTSRNAPDAEFLRPNRPFQKRFIFLGHVNEDKGIDHFLEAAEQLGNEYILDIYGPIQDSKYYDIFKSKENYQGVLNREEVLPTLQKYDVLVLPTFYRGEGYPGAIMEAYSIGLPVITTHWRAIPEIVEQGSSGLLIAPKSTETLVKAIKSFDDKNYPIFSKNALEYFNKNFNTNSVNSKALAAIENLINK